MQRLLQKLGHIADKIDSGCRALLGVQTFVIGIVLIMQIILRRTGHPIAWATEFCCLLFVWMTLLGSAVSSRYLLHIGVDALQNRLTGKAKKVLMIVSYAFLLLGLIIFTYTSAGYTIAQIGHVATTMPSISLAWFYCSLPICGIIMLYDTIIQFMQIIIYGDVEKLQLPDDDYDEMEGGATA